MRKNKKNVLLNVVLSLCLCLSLFFCSSMTADAAYATGRFPFNISSVPSSQFDEHPFVYLFQVRGSAKVSNAGHKINPAYPFGNYNNGGGFGKDAVGTTLLILSSKELALYTDHKDFDKPIVVLNAKPDEIAHVIYRASTNGTTWLGTDMVGFNIPNGSYFCACYFNPQQVYVMSNTDICAYDTGEVLYRRNIPDSWIEDKKNISDVTSPDDLDLSDNSPTKGDLLPEESDGTLWGNLFSYFAKTVNGITNLGSDIKKAINDFKDAMIDRVISGLDNTRVAVLQIIDNVQELPDKFVESIKEGKLFSPFDALFDSVNLKILDVIKGIMDIPKNIVDAILGGNLGELLENIFNSIISLPSSILDFFMDSPFYQLIVDIVTPVLDIAENLLNIPISIGKEIGKILRELFVPSSGYIQGKMEGLFDRFPFIGSVKSIVFSVGTRIKELGANPPVVTVPLSKTFLASYGVGDCTMTFEWFAPYRRDVLLIESAFLWGAFAFRMYFGIKHIFNATSNVMPYMYVESWRS